MSKAVGRSILPASAGLAGRLERRVSPRLGVRPVPLVRLDRVARAAETPLRLVAPAGTPFAAVSDAAAPEASVPPPPGMSQFAADWLFGGGAPPAATAGPASSEDAPAISESAPAVDELGPPPVDELGPPPVEELSPPPVDAAPPPVDAAPPPRTPPAGAAAPKIARSRLARRSGRIVERPAGTTIRRTPSERTPDGGPGFPDTRATPGVEDSGDLGVVSSARPAEDLTPPTPTSPAVSEPVELSRTGVPGEPDANAAPLDPAPAVATSAGPVRLSRTPAAPSRAESSPPPLGSSSQPLESVAPPPGSALRPLASPSPSSDNPAGDSPGGGLAPGGSVPPRTGAAPAPAPAILRLARPATTHPALDPPASHPPAPDPLAAGDPGLPVIRRSAGQLRAAEPVGDPPTGLRRLLAAVTGRRERSAAADAVGISRDAVAGSRPELSSAAGEPTPLLGARIARMAAATTGTGLADAGRGEPDARATGAAAPQDVPSPARLAAVGGGTIARSETGAETVTFAPPPGESAAPVPAAATPAGGSAASAAGSTESVPAAGAPRSTAPAREDIDDVYEQVLERLRHDLATEYERVGHSLDGLPRC